MATENRHPLDLQHKDKPDVKLTGITKDFYYIERETVRQAKEEIRGALEQNDHGLTTTDEMVNYIATRLNTIQRSCTNMGGMIL